MSRPGLSREERIIRDAMRASRAEAESVLTRASHWAVGSDVYRILRRNSRFGGKGYCDVLHVAVGAERPVVDRVIYPPWPWHLTHDETVYEVPITFFIPHRPPRREREAEGYVPEPDRNVRQMPATDLEPWCSEGYRGAPSILPDYTIDGTLPCRLGR